VTISGYHEARATSRANPGIPLHAVELQKRKGFLSAAVGLLFELGLIAVLIWIVSSMPDRPIFLR